MSFTYGKISLRIFSKALRCEEISKLLDIEPSQYFDKGEPIRKGRGFRDESLWVMSTDIVTSFEDHLEQILTLLENQQLVSKSKGLVDLEVFASLSSDNGQGNIFLDSRIINRVSNIGVELKLDVYQE